MVIALMLQPLRLPSTRTTPQVALDAQSGTCVLEGRAMPIDASAFFQPILDWLARYARDPQARTVVDFRLDYFNSGCSLQLARMVHQLAQLPDVAVRWYYHPDDEDILEAGQELSRMGRLPFEFVAEEM